MDERFWDTFAEQYWEKKPHVFAGVAPTLATAADILRSIQAMFESIVGIAAPATVEEDGVGDRTELSAFVATKRIFIEGRLIQAPEYAKFLPAGETLEEYMRIVSERLGGATFGIALTEAHCLLPNLFRPAVEFIRPLIDRIGIPAREVETAIYLGTYPSTPFGIHKDAGNAVWTFPVIGRKRFLLWPPDYFDANPLAQYLDPDPAHYLKDAIVLDAGPGDLMYWPADWLHIAHDPTAAPHAAFSIGTLVKANASHELQAMLEKFLRGDPIDGSFRAEFAASEALPDKLEHALSAIEEHVRSGAFRRYVEDTWRQRLRYAGFGQVPDDYLSATAKRTPES